MVLVLIASMTVVGGSQAHLLSGQSSKVVNPDTTKTFAPTDDATVDSSNPAVNYGSQRRITVDGSPTVESYLRFDLSSLQGPVDKAVLELVPTASNNKGVTVRGVHDNSWTQSTITYASAPAADSTAAVTSGPITKGTPVDIDVTKLVATAGVQSFAVSDAGSSYAIPFASSEATDYAGPKLIVSTPLGSTLAPLSFPIHGAFYYPWFKETWGSNDDHTHYHPTLGYYSSDDAATIDQHIRDMDYAGINLAIASWWGQGQHNEQTRIPLLMNETASLGSNLRWALYYEQEAQGDPSPSQIESDLQYIKDNYASNPWYAKINGKPVIFVYASGSDGCGMADRWAQANASEGFYVVLKVFSGFRTCASQPDGWHQYGPAVAENHQKGYSFSISPGFYKWSESTPRLDRDVTRWKQNIQDMIASNEPFQLVTTFNEFGEGTAVEPTQEWASASGYGDYLDALHDALVGGGAGSGSKTSDPVIAAAGDIACSAASPNFNGGDGTSVSCREKWTSDLLANTENLQAVLPLGDVQYECGNQSDFAASYDPTWGRFKSITHWVTGNHEYGRACSRDDNSYAAGYFGVSNPGDYYSYDVGSWHLIALNSECSYGSGATKVGGCGAGSAEETWLRNDLAQHSNQCTLAYWHEPRFSSGEHGDAQQMTTIWNDLVAAGVDVVLSGHNHDYERFDPIGATPSGGTNLYQQPNLDPNGIREFVVGTGGKNHYGFGTEPPLNGEVVRNSNTYGVLELTLHPSGYDWTFVNDPGSGSFTDSGSGVCH